VLHYFTLLYINFALMGRRKSRIRRLLSRVPMGAIDISDDSENENEVIFSARDQTPPLSRPPSRASQSGGFGILCIITWRIRPLCQPNYLTRVMQISLVKIKIISTKSVGCYFKLIQLKDTALQTLYTRLISLVPLYFGYN
jgi:hypothetical protein